jgi:hypothetical protein
MGGTGAGADVEVVAVVAQGAVLAQIDPLGEGAVGLVSVGGVSMT